MIWAKLAFTAMIYLWTVDRSAELMSNQHLPERVSKLFALSILVALAAIPVCLLMFIWSGA